jgi:hypothetical protein
MSLKKVKLGKQALDQTTITTNEIQRVPQQKLNIGLSGRIAIFLRKKTTQTLFIGLVFFYTFLVVIRISFEQELERHYKALDITELFILTIFSIEILLKISVIKKDYFRSWTNNFDIFILVTCFLVIVIDLSLVKARKSSFFRFAQILRIFRLFIMVRKVNELSINSKRAFSKTHSSVSVSTPSETVLKVLQKFINFDWVFLNENLKNELIWCYEIIKSRKIYEVNIITENVENNEIAKMGLVEEEVSENLIGTNPMASHPLDYSSLNNLEKSQNWDFDIFELEKSSTIPVLEHLTIHFFSYFNLFALLEIPLSNFTSFIQEISSGYLKTNLYHNDLHAADVVQAYFYLLTSCKARILCSLSDCDVLCCLVSAAIHDFEHPGVNNQYLINTLDPLAIRYNDKSVLENHHLASSFTLMQNHKIFQNFSKENLKKLRNKIINCVLATDFSRHFSDISKFKSKAASGEVEDEESRGLCMEMMMHTADVSNPSRPWSLAKSWAERVMSEFFLQGDKEREQGLPISHLCDRLTVIIPKSQVSFIDLFIEPTFSALLLILPEVQQNLDQLNENRKSWLEKKINY